MFIDYTYEPRRAIFFEDVKSNYASIECVERGLHPLKSSLCVMSRSDHSYGLILASSPKFKEVFGKSNVSRAADLPFLLEKQKVLEQMGLFVTVGMGDNPLLAKLAMDNYAKHSATMRALIRYEDVPNKVWTLPKMTDFWGIGRRTEKRFNKLGIYSIKDLAHANPDRIKRKMGIVGLQQFFHAHGIDETNVREKHHKKSESYSNSQILPRDYVQQDEIELVIKEMAEHLAIRLRKGKKLAGGLSLYVKPSYKEDSSSIKTASKIEPTQSTTDIQSEFLRLFREKYHGEIVREIGIGGFDLSSENIKQLNLFETMLPNESQVITHQKQEALQDAIDEIRDKFDFTAIQKASVLTAGSRVLERNKMIGGHAAAGGEKNDR
ncbi:DNA polymerase [Lactococcus garvieae]|uniref:DNA polymerase V n=1 Tax=Lactococcus garvieae TaxID=1363 RepID=A0A1I4EXL8_9LACT|nr:DNA polymerase [Lactococcus garvieae]SFL09943.1 DNA polymerase V [Lactococcus garvieae]